MNPDEFINAFDSKYSSLTPDVLLLNKVVDDIFNYWSPIQTRISNSDKSVFSSMKYDNSNTPWTQFNLGENLLRAERSNDRVNIIFVSNKENDYVQPHIDNVIGEIFARDGEAIYHATGEKFKVSDLDEFNKYLLA